MLDFLEKKLNLFLKLNFIQKDLEFSRLSHISDELINFKIESENITIQVNKETSSHFKQSLTLKPLSSSIGFLFSTTDLTLKNHNDLSLFLDLSKKLNFNSLTASLAYPYLLYGRLSQNGQLETISLKKISKNYLFICSTLSNTTTPLDQDELSLQLKRKSKYSGLELMCMTKDSILGLNYLLKFKNSNWSLGGELFYTHKEKSGGLSIASRYHTPTSTITFMTNPLMGNYETNLTAKINKKLKLATSFKFNSFSIESDLALGLEFIQGIWKLKGKLSFKEGLGLKLQAKFNEMRLELGMFSDFSITPKRILGLEIQIN